MNMLSETCPVICCDDELVVELNTLFCCVFEVCGSWGFEIFYLLNFSCRIMSLELTQPVPVMSTMFICTFFLGFLVRFCLLVHVFLPYASCIIDHRAVNLAH